MCDVDIEKIETFPDLESVAIAIREYGREHKLTPDELDLIFGRGIVTVVPGSVHCFDYGDAKYDAILKSLGAKIPHSVVQEPG